MTELCIAFLKSALYHGLDVLAALFVSGKKRSIFFESGDRVLPWRDPLALATPLARTAASYNHTNQTWASPVASITMQQHAPTMPPRLGLGVSFI